jgi:hypothetical protein
MSVMSCAPTAKPDERLPDQHPHRISVGQIPRPRRRSRWPAMAHAVHPMGDYWQAITYRRLARVAACSSRLCVGGNYMKGS